MRAVTEFMNKTVCALCGLCRVEIHFTLTNKKLYPIWLERYEQADLPVGRLCKVASKELHDGEGDDPDGDEG